MEESIALDQRTAVDAPASTIAARRKTSFKGDILRIASGTVISQIIAVVSSPIIARLFAPEAFGVSSLFLSITGILSLTACMGYDHSIILPKRDDDAVNLLAVSLSIATLFSLLTIPVILVWRDNISHLLNAPNLSSYLWLVPFSLLFAGFFTALNFWNSRTKHFSRLAVVRVNQSILTTLIKLVGGFAGRATGGMLIAGEVGGQAVGTSILGGQIWRDHKGIFLRSLSFKSAISNIKRYYKFPAFYTWSILLNSLSALAAPFFLAIFFSPAVVGFYALSLRFIRMPIDMIGKSIAQVFFQKAAVSQQNGQLPIIVERVYSFLVIVGLFPILLLSIIGKDLFVIVLGQRWAEAGVYAQMLALPFAMFFISSPLTPLTSVLEKQQFGLWTTVALTVFRSLGLVIGGWMKDARLAIMLFSISGAAIYGCRMFILNKFAGVDYLKSAAIMLKGVVPFAISLLLFRFLVFCKFPNWTTIIFGVIVLTVYMSHVYMSQKEMIESLLHSKKNKE